MSKISASTDDFKKLNLIEISPGVFQKAADRLKEQEREKNLDKFNFDNQTKPITKLPPMTTTKFRQSRLPALAKSIKKDMMEDNAETELKFLKPNKKVLNAKKIEIDGVKFDSRLEAYCHSMLKANKISFDFQVPFRLQQGFSYMGKQIQDIEIIIDFYLPERNMIIETKGYHLPVSKIKLKMLKHLFYKDGKEIQIHLPKNKEEIERIVSKLIL
jgi:hypothetical protein